MILVCSKYYDSHFKSSHLMFIVLCDRINNYICVINKETETKQVDFKQFITNHGIVEISRSEYIWWSSRQYHILGHYIWEYKVKNSISWYSK